VADGLGDERHGARGARVGLDDVDVLFLDAVLDVEQTCCGRRRGENKEREKEREDVFLVFESSFFFLLLRARKAAAERSSLSLVFPMSPRRAPRPSRDGRKTRVDSPTTLSSLAIFGVQSRIVASDFSEIVCVGIEHAESPEWTPA
jgi:hypothetical protein